MNFLANTHMTLEQAIANNSVNVFDVVKKGKDDYEAFTYRKPNETLHDYHLRSAKNNIWVYRRYKKSRE